MVMADQDGLTKENIETIAFATEVAKDRPLREKSPQHRAMFSTKA